ncbi:PREDICTED: uncharacterized protein LOC109584372 [Amphimedon queenslandica]|nr:PREDICTED: uncharacterized protein LOC109584372 [Amphimedon queenslandica]|eukprot:XP_019855646.1 PREDICTED: uncharacterized protein LOC109584372 [Amphimedon queenslandica]
MTSVVDVLTNRASVFKGALSLRESSSSATKSPVKMVKFMTVGLFVSIFLFGLGVESFPLMNLYGYVHSQFGTHLYTYNTSIIGYAVPGRIGVNSYRSEGIVCLLDSDNSGIPLYHYSKKGSPENLYTTNTTETAGGGYEFKGVVGYCYQTQEPHTVPLYRYKKTVRLGFTDHYYTTDANKIGLVTPGTTGRDQYTYEGVACFVYNVKYH